MASNVSGFDYTLLCATVSMPVERFARSYGFFHSDDHRTREIDESVPVDVLHEHLANVAIVEHEFFHCRHILSSTCGLFLHIVGTIRDQAREDFCENCVSMEMLTGQHIPLETIVRRAKIPNECMGSVALLYLWELLQRFIWAANRDNFAQFLKMREPVATSARQPQPPHSWIPYKPHFPLPPYLQHGKRPALHDVRESSSFTLAEILEGATLWRECLYISRLAVLTPKHFGTLTDRWRAQWNNNPIYRRVADSIFNVTGCNLSSALPGVMFDLALSGPFFSSASHAWSEVHPAARMESMLACAGALPGHLKKPDNLDFVGDEYYVEVADYFEKRLGWKPVRENLVDARSFVHAELERREQLADWRQHLGSLMFSRFSLPLSARSKHISTFLFPQNSEHVIPIGFASQPLITRYDDRVAIGALGEVQRADVAAIYLLKVAQTLASRDLVNDLPGNDAKFFSEARKFVVMCQELFTGPWEHGASIFPKDLDTLMTDWLGFDWREACRTMTRRQH